MFREPFGNVKKNHLEHQFEPESIWVPSPAGEVEAEINGCY